MTYTTDSNPIISNMAFETYVINVLRKYLSAQGKSITVGTNDQVFDAILIDGIDDISGPLYLEIKSGLANRSGYFRSVERFAHSIQETDAGAVLLIVGIELTDGSKQGMTSLLQSRAKRKAYVWDINDFNKVTEPFNSEFTSYIVSPAKAIVDDAINNPADVQESANIKESLINALKKEYEREKIALFLGAGVSKDAGIPQWNELINALLSRMIASRIKDNNEAFSKHLDSIINYAHHNQENSPITQMRYIKGAFSPEEYNHFVHTVLYSNSPRVDTDLLTAIAAICTPRRNHIGVQGVVTYNFDNLLERCLEGLRVKTNVISSEEDISTPDKLSIFHVHGYMPLEEDSTSTNTELIFSEEDYHRVYRDAYCWSNLAQLNYLREHTCLFIGCSLTDPNLRRLLDVAKRNNEKPRHYAFLRRSTISDIDEVDTVALEEYKKIDLSLRNKYYETLGLNIIWIDSYDEIPTIINGMLGDDNE